MKTSNHSKTIENEIPKKLNIQVQVGVAYIDGVIEHTSNESSNSFLRYLFFLQRRPDATIFPWHVHNL